MKAEIGRLHEQADAGEREKSAKKHYEKRVRELAQELTGETLHFNISRTFSLSSGYRATRP